jgi:GMP synthase (glutamine-hydrolysing)
MDPILVIENDAHDPLGHLGDVLEERNVTAEVVRPGSGEAIPSLEGYSAVVVLGGEQGAYESELHPHLADEMQLIRDAVASDVPLLGICLGAQLVAHALGGRAYLAERPEVAVMQPTLTAEGAQDPLAPHLVKPTLVFHQDSFEVPPGARTLAVSDRFPQVFRCGSALAIQPHPEVRIEDVEHWIAASDIPERAGVDADALLDDMRSKVDRNDAAALFEAWLAEVAAT